MKNIFEIMTDKWNEKATDEFCHIKINDEIKNNYKNYLDGINLENKVVIDYGCGGGHLGKYLFKEKGISKYIGFDICDKSIKAAKKNLKSYDAEIIKVTEHIDFSKYNANVFITFECIQHFPTFQYLLTFLDTVNKSKIPEIILQIRTGIKTFNDKNVMTFMCKIPFEIVKNNLKNYQWINRHRYLLNNINKECIYFENKNPTERINVSIKKIRTDIIGEGRENDVLRGSEFIEKEEKC